MEKMKRLQLIFLKKKNTRNKIHLRRRKKNTKIVITTDKMENSNKSKYIVISFIIAHLFLACSSGNKEKEISTSMKHQVDYVLNDSLSSNDYIVYDGFVPKDGFVSTPEIAYNIAESILSKIYGKENIEKQKPFSINLENDIWIIEGNIEKDYLGGVAYMEIRKSNGEVLKVLHGK